MRDQTGLAVPLETFRADTLPAHLVMNFKLIDEHGRQLDLSRNLAELRATHRAAVEASFDRLAQLAGVGGQEAAPAPSALQGALASGRAPGTKPAAGNGGTSRAAAGRVLHARHTNWDFGDLEDIVEVHNLIGYPAVVDHQA